MADFFKPKKSKVEKDIQSSVDVVNKNSRNASVQELENYSRLAAFTCIKLYLFNITKRCLQNLSSK